jgi:hypothetical protein
MDTGRSGSVNGSGSSRTVSRTLKMAVFAPIAIASVETATPVNVGALANDRADTRRSPTALVTPALGVNVAAA